MMNLDELQQSWTRHERRLDESIRLNRRILQSIQIGPARSALERLAIFQAAGVVMAFAAMVVLGSFLYRERGDFRFFVPALLLDLYALAGLVSLIRQIAAALSIDHNLPVTVIQRNFESLRILRTRYIQVGILGGFLLWTPSVIVLLKVSFNIDAYKAFSTGWLVSNLLFSVFAVLSAILISRKYAGRARQSPKFQKFMRDITGYNFNRAARFLTAVSDFERE